MIKLSQGSSIQYVHNFFSIKQHLLPPDTHTQERVSGGKKQYLFGTYCTPTKWVILQSMKYRNTLPTKVVYTTTKAFIIASLNSQRPKHLKTGCFFLINYFRQCKAGLEGKYSFKIKNENTRTTPTKVFLVSLLLTVNRHIFLWGFE